MQPDRFLSVRLRDVLNQLEAIIHELDAGPEEDPSSKANDNDDDFLTR